MFTSLKLRKYFEAVFGVFRRWRLATRIDNIRIAKKRIAKKEGGIWIAKKRIAKKGGGIWIAKKRIAKKRIAKMRSKIKMVNSKKKFLIF
jgi:hypothetical protein